MQLDPDDTFSQIQAASVVYRFGMGPNKGKKALTLRSVPNTDHNSNTGLVAQNSGFSLHAGVAIAGDERKKLEKLARYIARPPIAQDRLKVNDKGQVVYELKRPYDDGTTHIIMAPMELLEKITAIIPRPRVHLTRFHGVLAPHYKHRKLIVPAVTEHTTDNGNPDELPADANKELEPTIPKQNRVSWARLLKRVFKIDVEECLACGGKVRIVAAIEDPPIIKKILEHLGLPTVPPSTAQSRGPPNDATETPAFEGNDSNLAIQAGLADTHAVPLKPDFDHQCFPVED